MAVTAAILLLITIRYSDGYSVMEDSEGLTWPKEFHLKADKIDLKAGLLESMELWSSVEYQRSRIDFYNDLVKKYYYWETKYRYGVVYNFVHTTTSEYENKITCMETFKGRHETENLLPKVEGFEYIGEEELEGRQVGVWKNEREKDKHMLQEYTLYTYPSDEGDVPVRFVHKNFITSTGATTKYEILNYYAYEPRVDREVLDAGNIESCGYMSPLGQDFNADIKLLHPAKDSDVDAAFHSYKKHHGKNYYSKSEHEIRKAIFHENWEMVVNHNRKNHGYKIALNQFADYTADEMDSFTGLLPSPPSTGTHPFPHSDEEVRMLAEELPETYDMRVEGFISPVKNQASCGSCWAFATTAAVEGALARSNGGRILDLSEQSLIDCAWGSKCAGCNGGLRDVAFKHIMKHGIPMDNKYGPYLEQDGLCHTNNMTTLYSIKGFSRPTPYNPQALKVALYKYGPVAVGIHFNNKLRFYSSGIFYDPDCNNGRRNHAVLVVGYGIKDGVDYWIIKNSHGADWGQAGYLYISATDDNCLVLSDPVYPIV